MRGSYLFWDDNQWKILQLLEPWIGSLFSLLLTTLHCVGVTEVVSEVAQHLATSCIWAPLPSHREGFL